MTITKTNFNVILRQFLTVSVFFSNQKCACLMDKSCQTLHVSTKLLPTPDNIGHWFWRTIGAYYNRK